ncbi:MAG: hypothetical protein M1826_002897 [Phylliscum demangeonii]|nr:MAG: hypothetical protein M1826_002897 [Phylliscum demangeonii]
MNTTLPSYCSRGVRRWIQLWEPRLAPLQHVRGKKKRVSAVSTLNVRLLQDMPEYGRQGAIVPVTTGRMRNQWYPQKRAEYVTVAQLKALNLHRTTFERDFMFGMDQPADETSSANDAEGSFEAALGRARLSPQELLHLFAVQLPPILEFVRAPIPPAPSPVPAASSAAADQAAASDSVDVSLAPAPSPQAAIYGSVSTAEVAASITAFFESHPEHARIGLTAEEIAFAPIDGDDAVEPDRVKRLGTFTFVIQPKGLGEFIRRTVVVTAEANAG